MTKNRLELLRQGAILVTQGINPCGCIIFSIKVLNSQVILTVRQLTSPSAIQQFSDGLRHQAELHIFKSTDSESQVIHLKGKVTRGNGEDVVFTCQPSTDVLSELQNLNNHPDKNSKPDSKTAAHALKQTFQQHGIHLLNSLLSDFLTEATVNIDHNLADANKMREINKLKDVRFIFHSRQKQIIQDFEARFTTSSAQLAAGRTIHNRADKLRLLQQQVFEDWLELQTIASRLSSQYPDLLFALGQILNQIFVQDINDSNNPLSPVSLCLYLQYALDRLGIVCEQRRIIYQAFDTTLNRIWPAAIQLFIQECTRAGLYTLSYSDLPVNWSLRETSPAEDTPAPNTTSTSDTPDNSRGRSSDNAGFRTTDQSIFRLMGLQLDPRATSSGWQESNQRFHENLRPKRADLLQKLQNHHPELCRAIRELADNDPELGHALDEPTLQKANLVDHLFAPLQYQDGISDELKEKLEQLRLPVFEVLLETPEFLNEENHPAREIVNGLMKLCFAERISTKSLEATVTAIVEELVQAETQDPLRLQSLNQQLKTLVERQEQSFLRNAERLAKTLDGKERLNKTRQQVQTQLNTILAGKDVPTVLIELLESGWEQLMVLALLREGPDSSHHEELMNVVVLLQAWLAPHKQDDELAFERELESGPVLKLIDRELRLIGDIGRFRSVMARLTDQLNSQEDIQTVYIEQYGNQPDNQLSADEPEINRWVRRAREVNVGDWVELNLEPGIVRRMRLVWGGEGGLRFVFLSPKGMGEMNLSFAEFVQKLEHGEAWLVNEEEIPFVDQSLFTMVQDVYRQLNFQATHDPLTGCMRRSDFEKHVASMQERPTSPDESHVLIVLDIDEFSVINATYGAEAGDELLKATGELLKKHGQAQNPAARVGRISGNEFAVLHTGTSIEESLDFAEMIRMNFEQRIFNHGDAEYSITLSACVCPITGAAGTAGDLLNRASLALKSVKRKGGNRTELLRDNQAQPESATPKWVSEIDRSIRDGRLHLRAQSIVAINSPPTDSKSYEILLGITDTSGNSIPPQSYIEAAEQFRRSTRVDLWVVSETLNWMNDNPEIIANIDTLNVNLSGRSLSDDAFMLELESILRQNYSLTSKICFEVTETAAVSNLHYAADFIREMKRLKCRFALDDFGTGMSSYAYLQKLPVDYVKIDGIFVRDITTNLTNYAMVRSINELCHFLDLKTIAEYVEDLEILDILKEIQVDFAQGYGIANPRRLDSITKESVSHIGFSL